LFLLCLAGATAALLSPLAVRAQDPFAAGGESLEVKAPDGSSSLRAKLRLAAIADDMVLLQVTGVSDEKFPDCTFTAKVTKAAAEASKPPLSRLALGKQYRFKPVLKKNPAGVLLLTDQMTQNNLGACYFPKRTNLAVRVAGVDAAGKSFVASEIYVRE
jgi:hypothetical protein